MLMVGLILLFKMYAWPKFHGSSSYIFRENDLNMKTQQKAVSRKK